MITIEHEPKYKRYKQLLAERIASAEPGSPYSNMAMLELTWHHGFGFAVQAALKHVSTPFVMVIQVPHLPQTFHFGHTLSAAPCLIHGPPPRTA